jgi:hypothetical protein
MKGLRVVVKERKSGDWKEELLSRVRAFIQQLSTDHSFEYQPAVCYPRRIHLAVFEEPYLTLILERRKTLESRFSVHRCAPYNEVAAGDIVLLKRSAGPIVGIALIREATNLRINSAQELQQIAGRYGAALCVTDPNFWKQKQHAAFCTLMELGAIERIELPNVGKRDRTGWVVLEREQMRLFPPEIVAWA